MNLSYSKRIIPIQPTAYCLILFSAMLVGVLLGGAFYPFRSVPSIQFSESCISAFLSALLFLLTVFFVSSFSIGKYLCVFAFLIHGFLFSVSAIVFFTDVRSFSCLCLREALLLIGAFNSVMYHRGNASKAIFPIALILLISVLSTLIIL